MLKKITSILILSVIALGVNAAHLVGTIVDANSKEPLDYVNVIAKRKTSNTLVEGTTTNNEGKFQLNNLPNDRLIIEISFIGYTTINKEVSISKQGQQYNLGTILLQEDSKMLQEVEVMGQASQMKIDIDKKVYNVDQNLASAGGTASQVLENIPSVEVDTEGNIALRGSSSVEVWINGKPSGLTEDNRAQILEQMPAGSIQSVEVITNPSAKFNPEGTGGVINIVLKKSRAAGYFGSAAVGAMYPFGGKISPNVSGNINYSSSKIDAYANIGFRQFNMLGSGYTNRYQFTPNTNRLDTLSYLQQDTESERRNMGFFGRAGLDYHINDKNTIGFSLMGNFGKFNSNSMIDYEYNNFTPIDTLQYQRNNNSKGQRPSYSASLDYLYEIDSKGSEIRSSIAYSSSQMEDNSFYDQVSVYGDAPEYQQKQYRLNNNQDIKLKTDYVQRFGENSKLETGIYGSWQDRSSNSQGWNVVDADTDERIQYNDFLYKEWIAAAYATYGARYGNFSFQAGLRGEYTYTQVFTRAGDVNMYDQTNRGYFQLFPTLFLAYSLPQNNELQVNLTRRINRPRGRQLNAFVDMSDSTNISFGNPLLSPEYATALELNYIKSWEEHVLSASFYYRFTDNVIQQVRFLDGNNVMNTTYSNITKAQNAGLELVAKNKIAKWFNLTSTVNLYYGAMGKVEYQGTLLQDPSESFSWSARLMGNFMFPKGWSGQLTGAYTSPRVIAQGKSKQIYSLDAGIRKSFLNRTLNVNLVARDLLNSRGWKSTTWGDNFYQDSENQPHGRMIGLTVTYNFGNMKQKKKKGQEQVDNGGMEMMGDDF